MKEILIDAMVVGGCAPLDEPEGDLKYMYITSSNCDLKGAGDEGCIVGL